MIGIDVGGANLKLADENGVHIHYCPLWKGAPLREILTRYRTTGRQAAVVLSGELADCFTSKGEGIAFITDAVRSVFPDAAFYGTDAAFHSTDTPLLAAANWLASADFLRDTHPDTVLADIGSTTTDIIPLNSFQTLTGLTDLARLRKGYLIYTGMLRTSIPTLIRSVMMHGLVTPISTEHFACAADAHLVLGHISPGDYTVDAPDGGEKTVMGSLRRLSRVVCADLDEIGESGARAVATAFWETQSGIIRSGIERVVRESASGPVLYAGIGDPLFSGVFGGESLSATLGAGADALPAYAVREVALRDRIF
jgi:(4-(4-[2-(gamma-L-glutamylamino)ethyl]phenoxymethyl)furan-2-yl)methanamine synthase